MIDHTSDLITRLNSLEQENNKRFELLEQKNNERFELLEQENKLLKEQLSQVRNVDKLLEKDYQIRLEKLFPGCSHQKNKYGITDITTPELHIEIKNWYNYKYCVGQLITYNLANPIKKLLAAFFGDTNFMERAIEVMHQVKIDVWGLDIINGELVTWKYPYMPTETSEFIENHLLKTDDEKDIIDLNELKKYTTNTELIPLVGYKLVNIDKHK